MNRDEFAKFAAALGIERASGLSDDWVETLRELEGQARKDAADTMLGRPRPCGFCGETFEGYAGMGYCPACYWESAG